MNLPKLAAIVAILGTLAAFGSLSYVYSQEKSQRIACVHNQEAMREAMLHYQTQHAGNPPTRMWALWPYFTDPPENFGACPYDHDRLYTFDRETSMPVCPNPEHRIQ